MSTLLRNNCCLAIVIIASNTWKKNDRAIRKRHNSGVFKLFIYFFIFIFFYISVLSFMSFTLSFNILLYIYEHFDRATGQHVILLGWGVGCDLNASKRWTLNSYVLAWEPTAKKLVPRKIDFQALSVDKGSTARELVPRKVDHPRLSYIPRAKNPNLTNEWLNSNHSYIQCNQVNPQNEKITNKNLNGAIGITIIWNTILIQHVVH